ncbi:MAG: hypothetical protein ACO3JL_08075 [Myxococcota bacterium]
MSVDRKKSHPLLLAGALTVVLSGGAARAETPKPYGVELLPWSKKLDDDRYQSPRDYGKTLEHFKKQFKGWKAVRFHAEVNLPAVKYVHIENSNPSAEWAGINVYEVEGKVRMYVLKRQPTAPVSSVTGPSR